MYKNLKWRIEYLNEGWKYKKSILLDYKFWILLFPEPIKNKFTILSKKINTELYAILKKEYFVNDYFNFIIEHKDKTKFVKFYEPDNLGLKHAFAGEFLDLIYPILTKSEKNKIKKHVDSLKKINFEKMGWERNKTIFHYLYYYPIIKNRHWIFEGSYFNSNFNLDEKDVVYDVGAHIGLFSILTGVVIGNKGKVYAFDPSKNFNKYILNNAKLNKLNNIEIINVGLGDTTTKGHLKGMNFIPSSEGNMILTTLDKLYKEEKIIKPNFIKMDIEGFERNALIGGMELLKKSKPKLSICTYHLKDDHKVLKDIIKKMDKDYEITSNEYNKKYFAEVKN